MPKQHFRKAMAGIIAVMLLFSLAVFYSPNYQNLAGMAWKDNPAPTSGKSLTIGEGIKKITLYPVPGESGHYEGMKEAMGGKLKVKFKVDNSGKATLVKAYAKKPFIMGSGENQCGSASECSGMIDTQMEAKDKADFNAMVTAFETEYKNQNTPPEEPQPTQEPTPETAPASQQNTNIDQIELNGDKFTVTINVDIPNSDKKGTKVTSQDGQTVYYFDDKGQKLLAYSNDGGNTFEEDLSRIEYVLLSEKTRTSLNEQEAAKKKAEEEAAAKKAEEEKAKATGTKDDKKEIDDKAGLDKSSSTIAGLDKDGDVIVCENKACNQGDATFSFKYDSVFKGTEGYVYATSEGKRCTAKQAAAGEDCAKRRCDGVKGCVHESDGSVYCTTFDGLERCAADPVGYIENKIKECDKSGYAGPDCAGAQKRMDAVYDSLNFEFRSRVESVFGTLLDKMTKNFFSKMEYWMYDGICQMDYYNTGSNDVDLIAGVQITQEYNYGFDMNYLDQGEIIVTLGGEKETIDDGIFRYSFSIQTIGPVHGIIYLYNYCTNEKSFGEGFTGAYGWMDEFSVNKPLGVHRMHYAGDETTFACDVESSGLNKQECRFDHVCLKIFEDESRSDKLNEKYKVPICNKLGGEDIVLDPDTGDYDCGSMPANYYK